MEANVLQTGFPETVYFVGQGKVLLAEDVILLAEREVVRYYAEDVLQCAGNCKQLRAECAYLARLISCKQQESEHDVEGKEKILLEENDDIIHAFDHGTGGIVPH